MATNMARLSSSAGPGASHSIQLKMRPRDPTAAPEAPAHFLIPSPFSGHSSKSKAVELPRSKDNSPIHLNAHILHRSLKAQAQVSSSCYRRWVGNQLTETFYSRSNQQLTCKVNQIYISSICHATGLLAEIHGT